MKKVVICIIIILFILFCILFSISHIFNTKYSSEDIYNLVQKGIESMQDMQNVCIERRNIVGLTRFYYKGNKKKLLVMESNEDLSLSYGIVDLDKGKQYIVSDEDKSIIISNETNFTKGLQYDVFDSISSKGYNFWIELSYIKDEKINEKDCIFVKEVTYNRQEDGTYKSNSDSDEDVHAYWIEKSTGFVLGTAKIKPTQTKATPDAWIYSITFGTVKDSDFDLPTGYTVYDRSE